MKYYLRGFGIGVLFVTILFALIRKPSDMTEEDIQKRAEKMGMLTAQAVKEKELGVIQETELKWKEKLKEQEEEYKKLLQQKEETGTEAEKNEDGAGAGGEEADDTQADDTEENGTEADGTQAGDPETDDRQEAGESDSSGNTGDSDTEEPVDIGVTGDSGTAEPEYVQITITRGMSSEQVSALLQKAGLIDSAADFNRYLASAGKQSLISVGTYEISTEADYAEITAAITGQ